MQKFIMELYLKQESNNYVTLIILKIIFTQTFPKSKLKISNQKFSDINKSNFPLFKESALQFHNVSLVLFKFNKAFENGSNLFV